MGWRTWEGRGQKGSASSGSSASFHLSNCLLPVIIPPVPLLPGVLNISLPFASKSNRNGESCTLVTLMCRFGPDGAGYAGRILMEGGKIQSRASDGLATQNWEAVCISFKHWKF